MRRSKLIFSSILATVLGMGVIGGVLTTKHKNNVENVKAATSATVYYAIGASDVEGKNMKVEIDHRGSEGPEWKQQWSMTKTNYFYKEGWVIFSCTISAEYGGVGWLQFQLYDGSTWKWNDRRINKWTGTNDFNGKICVAGDGNRSWLSMYYYTFQPNGGYGSVNNQVKISDESTTLGTCDDVSVKPGGGRHFIKWGTNEQGTGTSYQPGANLGNVNITLYLIEDWYTYQYKVNSGSWNNLTKKGTSPSGYVAEFETDSRSFTTGDIISFRRYYDNVSSATTVDPSACENNIFENDDHTCSIKYTFTGRIYIKITIEDYHTIYADGTLPDRAVVIVRSGIEYRTPCSYDSGKNQFEASNITLLPGDTLKAAHLGDGAYTIYVENIDLYGISRDGVVSSPGVYTVYLKLNQYTQFNNVYLEMNNTASAKLIAQTFNNDMTPLCTSVEGGAAPSTLKTQWGVEAGYYSKLTSGAQNILNGTTSSSDTDVIAMRAEYDRIVGKYSRSISEINDYMGRNPTPIGNSLGILLFGSLSNNDSNALLAIVIVSILSVASIGGYFLIRRKKQK